MRRKKGRSQILVLKTSHSEHSEQVGFVNWFRAKYPKVLIFAIPNGEKRSISVATRLKAEGVTQRNTRSLYPLLQSVGRNEAGHGWQTFPRSEKNH